jgi:hypothetical protein
MILEKPALVDPTGTERIGVNSLNDLVELYGCRTAQEKDGTFSYRPSSQKEFISESGPMAG